MKQFMKVYFAILVFLILSATGLYAASGIVVGLYSETAEGHISYKAGGSDWVIVKVGMVIPASAVIKINVDRDWLQLIPAGSPGTVYELDGSEKGDVVKSLADVFSGNPKTVSFPNAGGKEDPAFKNKLVVKQVWGRQFYRAAKTAPQQEIRYGDVLDIKGNVNIIGINNTIYVEFPNGAVTNVIGPLRFNVADLMSGKQIYKQMSNQ